MRRSNSPFTRRWRRKPAERGIVLVMTVLVLGILLLVGYATSFSAAVNLRAAENLGEMLRRDCAAESALNYGLALLRVDAETNSYDTLDESWAAGDLTVQVGEHTFALWIVDENRKLNVNRAVLAPGGVPGVDLRSALRRLVIRTEGAERDFETICAWMGPAWSSKADAVPMRALLFSSSLRAIPGLEPRLFRKTRDKPGLDALLTCHAERINVNTASLDVLAALWDDELLARAVLEQRSRAPFVNDTEIRTFLQRMAATEAVMNTIPLVTVQSDFFTVTVVPQNRTPVEVWVALVRRHDVMVQVVLLRRQEAEVAHD